MGRLVVLALGFPLLSGCLSGLSGRPDLASFMLDASDVPAGLVVSTRGPIFHSDCTNPCLMDGPDAFTQLGLATRHTIKEPWTVPVNASVQGFARDPARPWTHDVALLATYWSRSEYADEFLGKLRAGLNICYEMDWLRVRHRGTTVLIVSAPEDGARNAPYVDQLDAVAGAKGRLPAICR